MKYSKKQVITLVILLVVIAVSFYSLSKIIRGEKVNLLAAVLKSDNFSLNYFYNKTSSGAVPSVPTTPTTPSVSDISNPATTPTITDVNYVPEITVSASTLHPGERANIVVKTKNIGRTATTIGSKTEIIQSLPGKTPVTSYEEKAGLSVGAESSNTYSYSCTTAGDFNIKVKVDYNNAINESKENDNEANNNVKCLGPDYVTEIEAPATANLGQMFPISVITKNIGYSNALINSKTYLKWSTVGNSGQEWQETVNPLAVNGSNTITKNITCQSLGTITVNSKADYLSDITENNEDNNQNNKTVNCLASSSCSNNYVFDSVFTTGFEQSPGEVLAIDPAGYVFRKGDLGNYGANSYVIKKFNSSGVLIKQFGGFGTRDDQFFYTISGSTLDSSGNIYIIEKSNNVERIKKFTSNGTYVTKWGSRGTGNGQFKWLAGVASGPGDYIYTIDNWNRVQKFTSNGTYVTKWGSSGWGPGQFENPVAITVDSSGYVYVIDGPQSNRVQKFTSDGTYVTGWGSNGAENGQFSFASGIAVDLAGNVYVADKGNNRVQKFTSSGTYITGWGNQGSEINQLHNPSRVIVSPSGNDVYVFDTYTGAQRIQKFDLGSCNG